MKINILGLTGNISRIFRKYLSNITGKHGVEENVQQPYWAVHMYLGM
jgi:hypothetical protein